MEVSALPKSGPVVAGRGRRAVDVAAGAAVLGAGVAVRAARATGRATGALRPLRPLAHAALHPPGVPVRYQPAAVLEDLARRGEAELVGLEVRARALLDVLVPLVVREVIARVDVTAIVRDNVDLDLLVAGVDLDAAARRLDLDAVAARLDIDAVARRLDLDSVARGLDLDAVAARLDVDAVAGRLDIDAVIARIDIVGIAEDVIAAVDLPEIIRESTGSVASESIRGARMQGISGDEAVGRAMGRLRFRRGRHGAPPEPPEGQAPQSGIPWPPAPGAAPRTS